MSSVKALLVGLAFLGCLALVAGLVCWLLEREFAVWEAFWGEGEEGP